MKISKGGNSGPRLEEGTYMARLVHVIGLGEHEQNSQYPEKGDCDKILFTVELPTETMEINGEEKVRLQSKQENMFLTEKANLVKLIKAADPKFNYEKSDGYEMEQLVGKPLMVTIGSTSGDRAKITQFAGIMKGLAVPPQVSDSIFFDFYEPDKGEWDKMMSWVQDTIKKATNFEGSAVEAMLEGKEAPSSGPSSSDMGDDIPF